MKKVYLQILAVGLCLFAAAPGAFAQFETPVLLPEQSQRTKIAQQVGLSEIKLDYCSPGVKNRKVWGEMVPYDKVWRAGANENTVIELSHEVTLEGKKLPAGKYGLHLIPGKDEWTVIFSKNSTSWGSYFYKEDEDALRLKVKAGEAEHREWLTYDFRDRTDKSVIMELRWEKLSLPLTFTFDTKAITVQSLRNQLRSLPFWGWTGLCQAARYCAQNEVNTEEALSWIERSVRMNKNFTNLEVKSLLMANSGKAEEAEKLLNEAYGLANENELRNYIYSLSVQEKKPEAALKAAQKYAEKFPKSFDALYTLAQTASDGGNKKVALKAYKSALGFTKDPRQRKLVESRMKSLADF